MRRNRRGGHAGREIGGSGEDSFVAVVVTKLTGALLFILLLTMVIMALLPKAINAPKPGEAEKSAPLTIKTPETLPEAIAGRPYVLALAAEGGKGPLRWSIDGALPEGLALDSTSGTLKGTPTKGTPQPSTLQIRVSDGSTSASSTARLIVYRADSPLTLPSRWDLKLPALPWRAWFEQGFGFLVLWLVYLTGQNALGGLRRWSLANLDDESAKQAALRRHTLYRNLVRVMGASAVAVLGAWLWTHRGA